MRRFIPINLKKHCNHKMLYRQLPNEMDGQEFGLDNICIIKSDVKLKTKEVLENTEFCFYFGQFDNVVCDRQKIEINTIATKLHLIGFAYWGDTNEYFKIVYDDFSEEIIRVPFIDWAHEPSSDPININMFGKNTSTVRTVITSGALTMLARFHHITCDIKTRKKIKDIVLPDNMFTHIFAMTLENENCHNEKQIKED